MTKPLIIMAAGGTGGHVMPAIAAAEVLEKQGYDLLLVTDRRGISLSGAMTEMPHVVMNASSHMAGGIFGKIKSVISLALAALAVGRKFRQVRPSLVIGFGGYPSLPPILAARMMRIPFMVHEQNAVLGRVNRWVAKKATKVALSYQQTARVPVGTRTVLTGNPVRPVISKLSNIAYSVPFGCGDIRIVVLGGSQGARILSDVVPKAIRLLGEDYRQRLVVSHQARPEDVERVTETYTDGHIRAEVSPFFEDVASLLVKTQLVIARAGASTLAECATMGRPTVLVPLKIAADDHQNANADLHRAVGGAWVLQETDFKPDTVHKLMLDLFDKELEALRSASEGMRHYSMADAAANLANEALDIAGPVAETMASSPAEAMK